MDGIRINKFISEAGICSRRNADNLIEAGRVKINGQVVKELGIKVNSKDKVEIDDKEILNNIEKIYIMLNKPCGYVSTSKEQFNRPSILDLIKVKERVFAVGRLDMDSEGLLILTNDGDLTNRIIHPTKHVAKKYLVELKNKIYDKHIEKLKCGVDIGGYTTKPAIVEKIDEKTILITIFEGKNRQIRKMCEAVGNRVINLKRLSIGQLELGNLKPGEYRQLSEQEIEKIFK